MNKRNFYTGLVVFAFFLFFYGYAAQFRPDATFWPQIICVAGMVLSAINTVIAGLKWKKEQDQAKAFPLSMAQTKRALFLLAVTAAWIFAIERLGFLISLILATGAIVLIFEPIKDKKHIVRDIIATVIFSVVLYLMFTLLGIHFPKGILI